MRAVAVQHGEGKERPGSWKKGVDPVSGGMLWEVLEGPNRGQRDDRRKRNRNSNHLEPQPEHVILFRFKVIKLIEEQLSGAFSSFIYVYRILLVGTVSRGGIREGELKISQGFPCPGFLGVI